MDRRFVKFGDISRHRKTVRKSDSFLNDNVFTGFLVKVLKDAPVYSWEEAIQEEYVSYFDLDKALKSSVRVYGERKHGYDYDEEAVPLYKIDELCIAFNNEKYKKKRERVRKFVALDELWDCGTCFHHRGGKCSPMTWCESGESYRPSFSKMTIYTFDENDVKMKTRGREGSADYEVLL